MLIKDIIACTAPTHNSQQLTIKIKIHPYRATNNNTMERRGQFVASNDCPSKLVQESSERRDFWAFTMKLFFIFLFFDIYPLRITILKYFVSIMTRK